MADIDDFTECYDMFEDALRDVHKIHPLLKKYAFLFLKNSEIYAGFILPKYKYTFKHEFIILWKKYHPMPHNLKVMFLINRFMMLLEEVYKYVKHCVRIDTPIEDFLQFMDIRHAYDALLKSTAEMKRY